VSDLELTAEELIGRLLAISLSEPVSVLDSCGRADRGGGLLIAGIRPAETTRLSCGPGSIDQLDDLVRSSPACFFTISYEQGVTIQGVGPGSAAQEGFAEPGVYAASYDALVFHDYSSGKTIVEGLPEAKARLLKALATSAKPMRLLTEGFPARSDTSRSEYLSGIEKVKELIRSGETYQTNLTQKIMGELPETLRPQEVFARLREDHPAEFSAFLDRGPDYVVSTSPERFFRVEGLFGDRSGPFARISASPIKGTRPRRGEREYDARMRADLASSEKDRAENTMIVDLLRNDLGRVCEYGSVSVPSLCEIQELPTLFHLVSTIEGDIRPGTSFADILRALFPCGSITGCPKLRTMEIIESLERAPRGLSMGAIGHSFRTRDFPVLAKAFGSTESNPGDTVCLDLSVAIRTMVIRNGEFEFNVGGGIVIDSDPESEYSESLDKAKALLTALGAELTAA
jgi:para-aminobenzoate synthetase component 1